MKENKNPNHYATGREVVSSGNIHATEAGVDVLKRGGNGIDAAVAMAFCMIVTEPHQNGLGGESPILFYESKTGKVLSISGVGCAPKSFSIEWCRENGIDLIPGDGFLPATVPAAFGTWFLTQKKFGLLKFSDLLEYAIALAKDGYEIYPQLTGVLKENKEKITSHYQLTREIFYRNGDVPDSGTVIKNPDLARTFERLRDAGDKGYELFYNGDIAREIVDWSRNNPVMDASGSPHTCHLTLNDFSNWKVTFDEPLSYRYQGLDVHKCPGYSQGLVFLQHLALRKNIDFNKLAESLTNHVHEYTERARLAFADREAYYGDPDFDDVPVSLLLSDSYNQRRLQLIGEIAMNEIMPGDCGRDITHIVFDDVRVDNRKALGFRSEKYVHDRADNDTTILLAGDRFGNVVSSVPSGGWIQSSPIIPGLGFALGTRGQMFYLNPNRSNALAPGKRPRSTLTPSLVTKEGKPYTAFCTPGGDQQDQWTFQFFINLVDYGFDLKTSLDMPLCYIDSIPGSFYPRGCRKNGLMMEAGVWGADVIEELKSRGHNVGISDIPVRMQAMRKSEDGSYEVGVRKTSSTGVARSV